MSRIIHRSWTAPRQKVSGEGRCRACRIPSDIAAIDPAHIVSRAQVSPGPGEHVDNIVPLCRHCHSEFDRGALDLLPLLRPEEQAYAVLVHPGHMLGALHRVTGQRWEPS